MSVVVLADRILMVEHASIEDAETLLTALIDHPDLPIDVSALVKAHLAVVQLLHVSTRPLLGKPQNPLLSDFALASLLPGETS